MFPKYQEGYVLGIIIIEFNEFQRGLLFRISIWCAPFGNNGVDIFIWLLVCLWSCESSYKPASLETLTTLQGWLVDLFWAFEICSIEIEWSIFSKFIERWALYRTILRQLTKIWPITWSGLIHLRDVIHRWFSYDMVIVVYECELLLLLFFKILNIFHFN